MKSILVTGSGGSAGNNVGWSLRVSPDGRSLSLTGTDSDRTSLELNRWLDNAYRIPLANDSRYLIVMNKIIQSQKVEGVFPQPDPEVGTISQAREKLQAKTYLPDPATVATCLDKYKALIKWHDKGLRDQPHLISHASKENLETRLRQIRFPCWTRARQGAGGLMSCLAKDWKSLYHWIGFHWEQGIDTDFIVEEYLPGRDYCFMSLWKEGHLVTSMVRERLSWVGHRTVGTGGTSKLNRVVHVEATNDKALAAIRAITPKPHGIFCVDLKGDQDDAPKPTEINCRFTTNVHYLTLASVKFGKQEWNFPWLAGRIMLSEQFPPCKALDALPSNLTFTKNVDMGYTIVEDGKWRAAEVT
jgi:predicted ATP-grasp superfamily ATP-dependent carboligase